MRSRPLISASRSFPLSGQMQSADSNPSSCRVEIRGNRRRETNMLADRRAAVLQDSCDADQVDDEAAEFFIEFDNDFGSNIVAGAIARNTSIRARSLVQHAGHDRRVLGKASESHAAFPCRRASRGQKNHVTGKSRACDMMRPPASPKMTTWN